MVRRRPCSDHHRVLPSSPPRALRSAPMERSGTPSYVPADEDRTHRRERGPSRSSRLRTAPLSPSRPVPTATSGTRPFRADRPHVALGVVTEFALPGPTTRPESITAGPDGNLWFIEEQANRIGRITNIRRDHRISRAGDAGRHCRNHDRTRREPLVHRPWSTHRSVESRPREP